MQRPSSLRERLDSAAGWIIAGCALLAVIVITALLTTIENAFGAGLMFVGLLVGGFLAIGVHELGHAVCARLVGWRVWIVSVMGVVHRAEHGLRLSSGYSTDAGGHVLGSPPTAALETKWRSIVFSAGGPLASVLTGPLLLYWILTTPTNFWDTPLGGGLFVGIVAFGGAGAWAALATLWPFRSRHERPNDMGMILSALFSRHESQDVRGASWAWALFDHGIAPMEWSPWMQESVARGAGNPWAPPITAFLAFVTALERNDESAARAAAQQGASDIGRLMRAYVAAFFDNNPITAETHLADTRIFASEDTLGLMRHFIDIRIASLKGDGDSAARSQTFLRRDLNESVPRPFWDHLFARHFPA